MCGIVGLAGDFSPELLDQLMESIRHRGEDYCDVFIDEENRIGLGHNLLSIFKQINENNEIIDNIEDNIQPIILNDLVLVFNGEIYNFNKLETFLKECNEDYQESKSDSRLLANILNYYFSLHDGNEGLDDSLVLLESVKSAVRDLDGDYSFAVYDRKYSNIAIARDQIGVKPLFY